LGSDSNQVQFSKGLENKAGFKVGTKIMIRINETS